ncbi:protein O-linked-mannose beta-1,4-N-acetylglucosaminyltransferase 2-like [Hibiscus syriacus]|uniref:Protein O-linked-mannose beta-1,4-N-acetylglucosaminyltransferase 2-like n=1 Tax=Hibiscus syriacus TaxID=106335 RepID=A0A6A3CR72_HIBSY|nr:uncharacterized protein LOC120141599 [Hibiscus syriacus]KAE8732045.1 protein O-linked-mannose beta-1,4-N-acetylglucosaminyltransferase 2-like [Hibiscus syriacus]
MGTKVQSKSYLPGYYSMRDLNDDSSSCSWPLYCGDKTLINGQYYSGFFPRAIADAYPGCDKNALKRKMLEHEAIFRTQVYELHRLYRTQKDLMDEIKKKKLPKSQVPVGPSFSFSPLASQITNEDSHKLCILSFPVANSNCAGPSVSGVERSHSPLSFVKGNSIQAGSFPPQNGDNSNDVEVVECRPAKVGRKTFDLELPADEYIDTEEAAQFKDHTAPGDVGKAGCLGDTSRSNTYLRGKNSLVDLNEPIQIEETNGSSYSHCQDPDCGGCEPSVKPKQELPGLSKEISINSHRQSDNWSMNNVHVESNGNARGFFPHLLEAEHCKANLISTSQGFQSEKLPVLSQQLKVLFDKAHDPPTFSLTGQSKAELSRETTVHSLEVSERNCEISNNSNPGSIMTSDVPSLNPFTFSDAVKQWSHSVSSWEKPFSHLNSMSLQTRPFLNSSSSFSKSSMMAPQSNEIFWEKWQVSRNSKLNPGFGGELPNRNGCYNGSSSGSKEPAICFPSIIYDYPKCSNDSKGVFEHFTHDSTKLYNWPNSVNMKSRTDMNLNALLSNGSSIEPVLQQGRQIDGGRKHEDHLPGLPWLRAKPACKNEATSEGRDFPVVELSFSQSSTKQLTLKNEIRDGFNQILTRNVKSLLFSDNANASRSEISEFLRSKMILGTPLYEKCFVSKNESSLTSPFVSVPAPFEGEAENKERNRLIDINLPCDATILDVGQDSVAENSALEKETERNLSSRRPEIDLNSCVDDNEASFTPSGRSTSMKMAGGIDLESPPAPELEDVIHGEELPEKACELPLPSVQNKDDCLQDELIKSAAEAIVAISSYGLCCHLDDVNLNPSETSEIDTLNWFSETISSFGKDLESKFEAISIVKIVDQDESILEEIDYFESMILELAETKEEDYMPKPLVPENFKGEETGTTPLLTTRTRKGQGRRGRQWRDFRKDILPGLASLSRHEVTEDIQTFGWLMRAMGHSWQSGLTKRNGTRSGHGRRRRLSVATNNSSPASVADTTSTTLVQQLNDIEVRLEDRSLTRWGKTTRRPRRQRCLAGNSPPLAKT